MALADCVRTADAKGRQHSTISNQKAKGVQVSEVTWYLPVANVTTLKAHYIG